MRCVRNETSAGRTGCRSAHPVPGPCDESDSEESKGSPESLVPGGQMPAQNDYLAVPGNAVTPEAVAGRDAAMFVVGAAEPVPSGMPPLASEPNKALVKVAVAHFAGVPKAHIGALSKSFGNFDRVVGIGWVIADAVRPLGAPLITRAEAHAIGGRAQRKAGDIKDEVRTARLSGYPACRIQARRLRSQAAGARQAAG